MANYRLVRGAVDLRERLFETLDDVLSGRISVSKAKLVCSLAREINNSVASELIEVRIMKEAHALTAGIKQAELGDGQ